MNKQVIYNLLPGSLRSIPASVWGYYLRWWRYSTSTESMIEKIIEHDTWPTEKWQEWQQERLQLILHRAATKVPYYRSLWSEHRRKGGRSSYELLENWPILSKKDLSSNHPKNFLVEDLNPKSLYPEHTSGTTGTPLVIYNSKKTLQQWYAIYEARIRHWNGVSRFNRWGIIGGQMIVPQSQTKPPFWVWNQGLNQLYLSAYHLSPQAIPAYIHAIGRYKLIYLLGYPSALYTIANEARSLGIIPPKLKVIIANAEPLFVWQKQVIEDYFQCPIRNTYGMSENVTAAGECSAGNLHLFPDVGITEVFAFDADTSVNPGETGRLICTGLINPDMPLIRYEVGDIGAVTNSDSGCSCGRNLPLLTNIEGRIDDMVITPDGRRIGRLDPVFKSNMRVKEAQIIQENLSFVRVKVVPSEGFNQSDEIEIQKRIDQRLGASITVVIETVDEIPRTKAGKFKAVISHVQK
ncbi:MAG: hypothetical protein CVU40_10125 [Chloroflexi bacterium HGW-Chloroflexi-2]|jgi:phenylacetate-CoA ligase|nr:MAG: hypothetical protein CVU40_10125 [Chloroflexi bacterium HGW-Chloroflexi-2]